MSSRNTSHSAPGSTDGSFAQVDYALLMLASGESECVGLETLDDDVVEKRIEGTTVQSQLKQSLGDGGYAVTPRSLLFWKTLAIWTDAAMADPTIIDRRQFVLVASHVGSDAVITALCESLDEEAALVAASALLKECKSPSETLRAAMDRVAKADAPLLARLLQRVRIREQAMSADAKELKTRLQIPRHVDPERVVADLRGWVMSEARRAWDSHTECWIDTLAFNTRKHEICSQLKRDRMSVRAWNAFTVALDRKTVTEDTVFMRQLHLIKATEEERNEAVIDYLKHRTERTRLTTDGEAEDSDWHELDELLVGRWSPRWRQMCEACTGAEEASGRRLYRDILQLDAPALTSSVRVHQPFCRGGYHALANERRVGWHPQYEVLLTSEAEAT